MLTGAPEDKHVPPTPDAPFGLVSAGFVTRTPDAAAVVPVRAAAPYGTSPDLIDITHIDDWHVYQGSNGL